MSSCEPVDDQNVTGVAHGAVGVGDHALWKSFALKCRIVGHVYPTVGTAVPVIRATAVAPALIVVCPVAAPNSPRYWRFAWTRTKTVAEFTRLPVLTKLPGAGHPLSGRETSGAMK